MHRIAGISLTSCAQNKRLEKKVEKFSGKCWRNFHKKAAEAALNGADKLG